MCSVVSVVISFTHDCSVCVAVNVVISFTHDCSVCVAVSVVICTFVKLYLNSISIEETKWAKDIPTCIELSPRWSEG